MAKFRLEIAQNLSYMLIRKKGLINFIAATCDLHQTSQQRTTFDQRFAALSTIITNMPALCCPLEEYFDKLAFQINQLLIYSEIDEQHEKPWKLAAYLFTSFYKKHPNLGRKYLLQPLIDGILCQQTSNFTVHQSLIAIHHLVVCGFEKQKFIPIFANLLFISLHLSSSISSYKIIAAELIIDMIQFIDHSVYMLDHALSNFNFYYPLYKLDLTQFGRNDVLSIVPNEDINLVNFSHNMDIKTVDIIVQEILQLICKLDDGFQIDFFLVTFSRTKYTLENKLLYLALIDSMQEHFSSKILLYPGKAIQFITSYLKRISKSEDILTDSDLNGKKCDNYQNNELKKEINILQLDSLGGILQIVSLIIEQKNTVIITFFFFLIVFFFSR